MPELFPLVTIVQDTLFVLGPHANQQFYVIGDPEGHFSSRPYRLPQSGARIDEDTSSWAFRTWPYLVAAGYDTPFCIYKGMQNGDPLSVKRSSFLIEPEQGDTIVELTLDFKDELQLEKAGWLDLKVLADQLTQWRLDCGSPTMISQERLLFPVFKQDTTSHLTHGLASFTLTHPAHWELDSITQLPEALRSGKLRIRDDLGCGQRSPILYNVLSGEVIDLSPLILEGDTGLRFVHLDHRVVGRTIRVLYMISGASRRAFHDVVDMDSGLRRSHVELFGATDWRTMVFDSEGRIRGISQHGDSVLQWSPGRP